MNTAAPNVPARKRQAMSHAKSEAKPVAIIATEVMARPPSKSRQLPMRPT
ncbi:hypothetical protein [Candidatus Accumulibacter vicinus]|nr:hypothetical protein [Candidatus Accumulibacter vicinus]